jgi:glyoxylase-like metal-dependent hydrolase (beta-lactamase superfamily II)
MKIDRLVLGAYETNCYILRESESASDCLIIDTGLEAGELVDFLHEHKLNPTAVVLTHGHIDHIGGLAQLRKNFTDVKVYVHKRDANILSDWQSNLSFLVGVKPAAGDCPRADFTLEDSSIVEQAGIKLEVLHTPGHTPGGICLYVRKEQTVFVGDTLFADSVGRTDMPGGSMTQLLRSIKEKLLTLPDETVVYPGHGPKTTISRERTYNQYLQ